LPAISDACGQRDTNADQRSLRDHPPQDIKVQPRAEVFFVKLAEETRDQREPKWR